jgi:Outer membrane protein beta-barrel domain
MQWFQRYRAALILLWLVAMALTSVQPAFAGETAYVGAMGGIATLSADAASQPVAHGLSLSSYAPSNGGALDLFAGVDLHEYLSLQGDFIWNRNALRLNSSSSSTGAFYQEDRNSSQQAGIVNFLFYFRCRNSRVRPYLAVGTGIAHISSSNERVVAVGGKPSLPPARFSWTGPVLRTHVGIDLRLVRKLAFRYSFSETIGHNEISKNLSPSGSRGLANFQNLFGFVVRF